MPRRYHTLSNIVSGGTWSSSATSLATITATGIVTGVATGTTIISYSVTSFSCGPGTSVRSVIIKSRPSAGTISGTTTICAGATTTLTSGVSGGVWTTASTAIATVNSTTGTITAVAAGSTPISYSVTNSCGTATATATLTVNTVPVMSPIAGADSVCVGGTVVATGSPASGTWSLSNGNATSSSATSTTRNITGVAVGFDTLMYTATNACGTSSISKQVKIYGLLSAGTISGATSICEGATTTLTSTVTGGVWTSRTIAIATVGATTGIVTGVSGGTDTIVYAITNSCGTATATYPLIINALPSAITVSGPTSVCPGSVITLTPSASGGSWSVTNATASVSTSGIVTGITPGIDTVRYSFSNTCGTIVIPKVVTIIGAPVVGTIGGPGSVCAGSTITLTDSVSGGTWRSSTPSLATIGASSGIVRGIIAGIDTITYTVANACTTTTVSRLITIIPMPDAGTIAGAAGVCPAATVTLTSTVSGGTWGTVTGNTSVTASGVVTGIISGSDTITYTFTNACGTAVTKKAITVLSLPSPAPISGTSVVCPAASITLTDTSAGGSWSVSNSTATVSGGVVTGVTAGIDTVFYTLTNVCGSTSVQKIITVAPLVMPVVSAHVFPDSFACAGDVLLFYANVTFGGSAPLLQWRRAGVLIGTGSTVNYSPADGDAVTCTLISSDACALSDTVYSNTITVHTHPEVTPITIISASPSDTAVTPGQVITFTASATACGSGALYQWFLNGTPVVGETAATYALTALKKDTVYCVVSCDTPCALTPFNHTNSIIIIPGFLAVQYMAGSSNDVSLFPNPNSGTFDITGWIGAGDAGSLVHLSVLSIAGAIVYEGNATDNGGQLQAHIELPDYIAPGNYLLRIVSGTSARFVRFLKN